MENTHRVPKENTDQGEKTDGKEKKGDQQVDYEEGVEFYNDFKPNSQIRQLSYILNLNILVLLVKNGKRGFLRFLNAASMESVRKDLILDFEPVSMRIDPDETVISVGLCTGEVLFSSIEALWVEDEPFEE